MSDMSASKKKQVRREAALTDPTLTEKQKKELREAKTHKRNVILGTVVGVIIAVLVVILLVWNSGVITRHTTALTANGYNYSVTDMDFYYYSAMNSQYQNEQYYVQLYAQIGQEVNFPVMDPSGDLTQQFIDPDADEPQSYHDYFLETAKANAAQIAALCDAAEAENFTLSEESQKTYDEALTNLDTQIKNTTFATRGAYLKAVYGRSMTEGVYLKNLKRSLLAQDYQAAKTEDIGASYTDEELDAYYQENPDTLDTFTYNYAYFDGSAASTEDADGETVEPTDEEKAAAMAAAKEKADALLAEVKKSTSTDPEELGSNFYVLATAAGYANATSRGSLGADLGTASYVDWLKDQERKAGDADVFEMTDGGYYVVQFVSRERNDYPLVDVRHILLKTNLSDNTETTDVDERLDEKNEKVIEVKTKAQKVLDDYLAGEQTAEAFGALADEHSEDGRDTETNELNAKGGLYTNVENGQMVQSFNDWIMDPSRQAGDTDLVLSEFGWHVMYFQESHDPKWKSKAVEAKTTEDKAAWLEEIQKGYEPQEGKGWAQVGA